MPINILCPECLRSYSVDYWKCPHCNPQDPYTKDEAVNKYGPPIKASLVLLNEVIDELENGFIACSRCGDQEDTKTLDCMTNLKAIKSELLRVTS